MGTLIKRRGDSVKFKIACILFLCLGFGMMIYHSTNETTSKEVLVSVTKTQQGHLKIINAITDVKRGGTGIITIQGEPNTLYSIKTSYKLEGKTIFVTQWRNTDRTGVTTFNWIVSMDTTVGTYNAMISGGGDSINTNHRVLQ